MEKLRSEGNRTILYGTGRRRVGDVSGQSESLEAVIKWHDLVLDVWPADVTVLRLVNAKRSASSLGGNEWLAGRFRKATTSTTTTGWRARRES